MGTPNMNDENGNEHHLSTATSSEQENASDNERPLNELDMISISDAQVQEIPNLTVPHNNDAQVQEIPNLTVPHNNDAQVQEISNLTVPHNRDRRGSLPPVFEQHHVRNNKICGKILRVMGDDHFSKACGKHLRFMGDEMCLSYELRNRCLAMQQDGRFHTSSSLPDLRDRREI